MKLNYIRNQAYQTAKEHGWHDEEHSIEHWLGLIITEIGEAVQADRSDRHADMKMYFGETARAISEDKLSGQDLEMFKRCAFDKYIKDSVEDELADIFIRALDLAGLYNLDLSFHEPFLNSVLKSRQTQKRFSTSLITEWGYQLAARITSETDVDNCVIFAILRHVIAFSISRGIDIEWFIANKMMYNKSRAYRHGNKKY